MNILKLKRLTLHKKDYIKRKAEETDTSVLITEPTILVDEESGQIKAIYDILNIDTSEVVKALKKIRYSKGKRARGLVSTSRVFGYKPRHEIRQDYCSATSLSSESPREHDVVASLALKLEDFYKQWDPNNYSKHKNMTEGQVKKNWRIGGNSIFTSGIINKNNPLKYHHDTGNFNDVYSMMIVFKGGVEGGYLSLPEYDAKFMLPNNSLFMFDGQGIIHGVTPIKYTSPIGYRFSVVYYTLKRMWQCLTIGEEIERINEKKTEKERVRMEVPLTEVERMMKSDRKKMLKNRYGKQ